MGQAVLTYGGHLKNMSANPISVGSMLKKAIQAIPSLRGDAGAGLRALGYATVSEVAFASYAWPFVKLVAGLALWWMPPRLVSISRRGQLLRLLELTGKYGQVAPSHEPPISSRHLEPPISKAVTLSPPSLKPSP